MFILCIILPPIAAGISGGFSSFFINLILTCCGWLPGMVHAFMVTKNTRLEEKYNPEKKKSIFSDMIASLFAGLVVGAIIFLIFVIKE